MKVEPGGLDAINNGLRQWRKCYAKKVESKICSLPGEGWVSGNDQSSAQLA
jgi:hypothetical protein